MILTAPGQGVRMAACLSTQMETIFMWWMNFARGLTKHTPLIVVCTFLSKQQDNDILQTLYVQLNVFIVL